MAPAGSGPPSTGGTSPSSATSTQKAGSNVQQKANAVELQYDDSTADNVYAELCAYEAGTAIYQDIRTVPGTLYKVRLKHASLNSTYLDKMQVMIGAPGHDRPSR